MPDFSHQAVWFCTDQRVFNAVVKIRVLQTLWCVLYQLKQQQTCLQVKRHLHGCLTSLRMILIPSFGLH